MEPQSSKDAGKFNGNIGYIDLIWKGKLLVEHKSRGKDLNAARSQGLDYVERLKPHERPRWLVTSDFARFHIHDLHSGHEDSLLLTDLAARAELFGFLAGYEPKRPSSEAPVNLEAVARLGGLYDAMKAGGYPDEDLPMFLVRVLFCLFAEDTGVFWRDGFTDFITYREIFHPDRERVEYLFALYEQLAAPLAVAEKNRRRPDTISKS